MGIVEKAIQKSASKRLAKSDLRRPNGARGNSWNCASTRVLRTQKAKDHGLVMLSDSELLDKQFRFLKRPVLARIFVPDRSENRLANVVMVTSDLPEAGKSFTAFNLAASIAKEQMTKVVLIDADPIRRTLSTALEAAEQPGLLELLQSSDYEMEETILATDMPHMYFLPCGQPHSDATEWLASPQMSNLLDAFNDSDTVVILDSAPLLLTSEAGALLEKVDHTLVVVEAGVTTASQIEAILKMLGEFKSSVSLVLNKAPLSSTPTNQGYYQYY